MSKLPSSQWLRLQNERARNLTRSAIAWPINGSVTKAIVQKRTMLARLFELRSPHQQYIFLPKSASPIVEFVIATLNCLSKGLYQ